MLTRGGPPAVHEETCGVCGGSGKNGSQECWQCQGSGKVEVAD